MNIQLLILNALIYDREYLEKVLPFLHSSYFDNPSTKAIFNIIDKGYQKYNNPVSVEQIALELSESQSLSQEIYDAAMGIVKDSLKEQQKSDIHWLIDQTEQWCKKQALYNALSKSVAIWKGENKKELPDSIPEILQEALSVSFNTEIGLDYSDTEEIFQRLNNVQKRLPFDVEILNKITGGGFPLKTLNIVQAAMGVGKSAFLCSYAASQLRMQKNVLYISMEMSEESIATRIDANLLDISFNELVHVYKQKSVYEKKRTELKKMGIGRLYIKEYPPGGASDRDFENLLRELRNKKKFAPDVICIDYLGICKSSRISASQGSYHYLKAISEELRALAVRHECVVLTATQTNRDGVDASAMSLKNIADSIGVAATADWIMGIISLEEHANQDKAVCTQLKNRYSSIFGENHRFYIGYCREKSQFFDVEQPEEESMVGATDVPGFDKSTFGRRMAEEKSGYGEIQWG